MKQTLIEIGKVLIWWPRALFEATDPHLGPDARAGLLVCVASTALAETFLAFVTYFISQGGQGWKSLAVLMGLLFYFLAYFLSRSFLKEYEMLR